MRITVDANDFFVFGPYQLPEFRSGNLERGAYDVTNLLHENPTPETLDRLMEAHPSYRLRLGGHCGYTALAVAIKVGAIPLIKYILDKDPKFVNAAWGFYPYIHTVVRLEDPEIALKILKIFHSRGANINLVSYKIDTPLSVTLKKETHNELTKFLIKKGGVIFKEGDSLAPQQQDQIQRALDEISAINRFKNDTLTKEINVLSRLPAELRLMISDLLD